MESVCVARDVSRRYGDTVALDGIDLSVYRGEILGLVGPNGAGKTTLVRALTGTTDASGSVELFGTTPRRIDRERIGLLPQSFEPPSRLTARELVSYYGGLYDDARSPETVLADVGVSEAKDTRYEHLSGGQQRRVCVATTLVHDPDFLILDEPTTGVDPSGRRALWRLLFDLRDEGRTVLFTTHYMDEAEELADRVGLMADGQLVALDDPDGLIGEYAGGSRLHVDVEGEISRDHLPSTAQVRDGTVIIPDISPTDIGSMVQTLEDAGMTVDSLSWAEPDLEDVFHSLTGRERNGRESENLSGGGRLP